MSSTEPPGEGAPWDAVRHAANESLGNLFELQREIWPLIDARLLDLCRVRIAQLLGCDSHTELRAVAARHGDALEQAMADLPAWPTSPSFDARERACLALAEQFVIDVGGVDDRLVDDVTEHMTAGECYAFVVALWLVEAVQRSCLVLDVAPDPDVLGLARTSAGPSPG